LIPNCLGKVDAVNDGRCVVCPLSVLCEESRNGCSPDELWCNAVEILHSDAELRKVLEEVNNKQCPVCGEQFSTWGQFALHKIMVHDEGQLIEPK